MHFTCRECGTVVRLDPERVAVSPRVQCPGCGRLFRLGEQRIREPAESLSAPQPQPSPPPVVIQTPRRHEPPDGPRTLVTVQQETPLAPSGPEPNRRPRWRPSLATAGLAALVLVGFTGWLWTAWQRRPAPQTALKPVLDHAARPPAAVPASPNDEPLSAEVPPVSVKFDATPWMSADFVLVNPLHYAVAVAQTRSAKGFKVLAKAEAAAARAAAKTAWESSVPIVNGDPKLARTVYARSEPNEEVPVELRPELETYWRKHQFVPQDASLVAYNDLAQGQRRVGYRRAVGEAFEFRELLGSKFERVPLELIQPGTLEENLDDERLATGTDFLDVCLYQICRRLGSPGQQASYLQVVIEPAIAEGDDLSSVEARIGELNRQLDSLADEQASYQRRSRVSGQEEERPDLGNRQRELEARKHDLEKQRELTLEARRLTGEVRSKLSQLGVPLLERSEAGLAAIGRERKSFQRPAFEQAVESQLLGATHLVLTDIRPPARRGRYELSMRCVSVGTAKVVWEGQGDRLNGADTALDLAGSPYLLNSGRLSVVHAAAGFRAESRDVRAAESGGWSLFGPALKLVPLPVEPEKTTGTFRSKKPSAVQRSVAWLGYIESGEVGAGKPLLFRDLFRKESQLTESHWIERVEAVDSLSQVPEEHHMRYVVWRLVRSILPVAGRITLTKEPRQVEVGLRRQDGVRQGDRLVVLRPTTLSGGGGSMDVPLPTELILTAVHDHGSRAFWDGGPQAALQDNDVAHVKPKRKPMVALMELTSDLRNVPPGQLSQLLRTKAQTEPELLQFTEYVGKRLTTLLQGAFVNLQVSVVERENLDKLAAEQRLDDVDTEKAVEIGRLVGATHLVLGRLSPGLNDRTAVSLRVVAVDSGGVIEQIEFSFTRGQMDNWKP